MKKLLVFLVGIALGGLVVYLFVTNLNKRPKISDIAPVNPLETKVEDALSKECASLQKSMPEDIKVTSPSCGAKVTSPLKVSGEAKGTWFFEASFPIRVEDSNGQKLGDGFVSAKGEWMTESFVPFDGKVEFVESITKTGYLVLMADNPSGLPANAKEYKIPIKF